VCQSSKSGKNTPCGSIFDLTRSFPEYFREVRVQAGGGGRQKTCFLVKNGAKSVFRNRFPKQSNDFP